MTKEEYLIDTLEYYSPDPVKRRSFTGEDGYMTCEYNPTMINKQDTSDGCGIGRVLPQELKVKLPNVGINTIYIKHSELYNQFPDWMKLLGVRFLGEIQALHDSRYNWTEIGLSETGRRNVLEMISEFDLQIDRASINKYLNLPK